MVSYDELLKAATRKCKRTMGETYRSNTQHLAIRKPSKGRDYLRIIRCQVNRLISKLWGEVGQIPVTFQAGFVGWRDLLLLQLYGTRTSQQAFLLQAKAKGTTTVLSETHPEVLTLASIKNPQTKKKLSPMPSNSSSGALRFEGTTCH